MNNLAACILFIGLCLLSSDICHSLDCISGHKAACDYVAKRYEVSP